MGSGWLSNTFTTQGYLSPSLSNLQDSWVSRKVPTCCAAHREHHPCWGCFPSYLSSPLLRARERLSPGHLAYVSPKEAFPRWGHRWFAVQQQDALSRQTQRETEGKKVISWQCSSSTQSTVHWCSYEQPKVAEGWHWLPKLALLPKSSLEFFAFQGKLHEVLWATFCDTCEVTVPFVLALHGSVTQPVAWFSHLQGATGFEQLSSLLQLEGKKSRNFKSLVFKESREPGLL